MKIVIISAMIEEIKPIIDKYNCEKVATFNNQDVYEYNSNNHFYFLNSGIGKVNATITTMEVINELKPDLILNIGTSGGLNNNLSIGDVVIADKMAFHDVDVTAFGYEIGQVPGDERFYALKENKEIDAHLKELFKNVFKGLVVSGDQFISTVEVKDKIINNFKDVYAVEMESAAIVKTAQSQDIDIYVARTISDLAHEESGVEFKDYIDEVSKKFVKLVELLDE